MLSATAQESSSSAVTSPTTPPPPPPPPPLTAAAAATTTAPVSVDDKAIPTGKKPTRQWDAWTREEEESFFIALRHVGKNFEKITSRVQSKNKDQVRHYYYRLIRRINKLLGPDFSLDAKNSKDANSAMLRWWSLLEKQSCSASKLHLKPRRFKSFVTALEHQIMKDRVKATKKKPQRAVSVIHGPVVLAPVARKPSACGSESAKTVAVEDSHGSKPVSGRGNAVKRKMKGTNRKKQEPSQPPRKRKKGTDCNVSAAAIKRWEKAASAGVSLMAEAAEQLERAAAEQLGQVGPSWKRLKLYTPATGEAHPESLESLPKPYRPLLSGSKQVIQGVEVEATMEEEQQASKLKLQLYPIDEATRKCMEQDGLNPYLELTLKPRKAISSVLRHLIQKWGGTSAAAGELHLFPFTMQVKSMITCQSWSINDATFNAGDVYAALGNPSVFRLRYGWLPSRILQSSHAECSQVRVSSSVREEAGLQASSMTGTTIDTVHSSVHVLPLRDLPSFVGLDNASGPGACQALMKSKEDSYFCAGSMHQKELQTHAEGGELPCVESVRLQSSDLSDGRVTALSRAATLSIAQDNRADVMSKRFELVKNTSLASMESLDGLIQVDARNAINTFGQGSAGCHCDNGKGFSNKAVHKVQESGGNLGTCSWLYEGSNDSFAQRIWAVEDPANSGPLLPTEIDWADSLTNISVGDFLNEVSQTGHLTSGVASIQALQPMQSLDSFDAAVAAQSAHVSGIETSIIRHPETPAWDGEETRDAFAFRKVVSQRQTSVPIQCSSEPPSFGEALRESDGMAVPFADCGSLEAWKQSFSHAEFSYPEELKCDSGSRILRQQLEFLGKGSYSQDFAWADSPGAVSLGVQEVLGSAREECFLPRHKAIGGTLESSLDMMHPCSAQGSGDNGPSSSSCGLQSTS